MLQHFPITKIEGHCSKELCGRTLSAEVLALAEAVKEKEDAASVMAVQGDHEHKQIFPLQLKRRP